jgi:hypothetical protein
VFGRCPFAANRTSSKMRAMSTRHVERHNIHARQSGR